MKQKTILIAGSVSIVFCLSAILIFSNNHKSSAPSQYLVRMALIPLGATSETYYFEVTKDDVLEVSSGDAKEIDGDIRDEDFMRRVEMKESISLSKEQINQLNSLINKVYRTEKFKINPLERNGGNQVKVLIKNKAYSIFEDEHKESNLNKLIQFIFNLSPIEIKPGNKI